MKGLLPYRLEFEPGPPLLQWIATDGRALTEPFFERTIARLGGVFPENRSDRRRRTTLDALLDVAPGVPLSGIVFHVSRCGSTLLAQMLAALPRHIVASEPPVIDEILRIQRRIPDATEAQQIAWLRGAIRALGQTNAVGGERLFLKVDCWSIFQLPLLRQAFPQTPFFFVYRNPLEVLVSLLRMPSYALVRDVVTPTQLGLSREARDALDPENYAAAVLGAFFRAALTHRAELIPVNYEEFPDWVWMSMPGECFDNRERAQMQEVARMSTKAQHEPFVRDSEHKRDAASASARTALDRWTAEPYARWQAAAPLRQG